MQHCLRHYQSPVCVDVCVCSFEPGGIVANAHSQFPIKSTLCSLCICGVFSRLPLPHPHFTCHIPLFFLVHFLLPAALTRCQRHFDGFCKLLMETCWQQKKQKQKTKKRKSKMKKRQLKMFEIVSYEKKIKNSSLSGWQMLGRGNADV